MKILVATALTQGIARMTTTTASRVSWCGCKTHAIGTPTIPLGRAAAGAPSQERHRTGSTTTAMVVESDMTRDDVVLAFRTSLADGGWPVEWAETVADDNMEIAGQMPVGSILIHELDAFYLRGALLR